MPDNKLVVYIDSSPMKSKFIPAIAIVVAVLGGLGAVKALQIRKMMAAGKNFSQPPETVSSAVAKEEKWQDTIGAVASVTAAQGVNISSEVSGTVAEIAFESGAWVQKGGLLVRLDTSSEEAQLRSLQAQADLARLNAERARKLRADNMIAAADLDAAEASLKQAQANADAVSATIAKKTICAPFAGRLGIRQVNLGEYVDAGKTTIVSLQDLDTVYADFSLPQQELARLKPGFTVELTTDTYPNRRFEGELTSLNPDLDVTTRSVRLQATFKNKDQLLRPGMFARVEVLLPGEQDVLTIPATSILSAPYGNLVFVIGPGTNTSTNLVVTQQFVRTGTARGDFISVTHGLKPGDKVVRSGLFKLRNGMPVQINNEIVPKAEPSPRPANS
jgi:membrane fusion protein (multidrug efflux system)